MWPEWLECQNKFECKFFITFGLLHVSYHCAIAQKIPKFSGRHIWLALKSLGIDLIAN